MAAIGLAGMLATGCNDTPKTDSMSFDEIVASRRSVRQYDPEKKISEAEIRTLIETAIEAPPWANNQPVRYYVAIDPEKVQQVRELLGSGNMRNTAGAPVLLVTTFKKGGSGFFRGTPANELGDEWGAYDAGLSNAFFILKARERGYDTLIMGMRDSDGLRKVLNIPNDEEVTAVISVGYRVNDPNRPARKSVDDITVFF
ncbi:MAG: nitroreductase family protein [Bacteroidales bacterium]|nr:nitroreductase family protein [Bacteroidales bacterium]